jgi:biopolymer transport protein ExbD
MGAVDLGGGGKSHKKGTGPKKPKRTGFKLDMTPLVDVAFLLLTFFMFATTMSQPQLMDIRVPVDDVTNVEVRASELWTIFVSDKNKVYYNTGLSLTPVPLKESDIKAMAVERNRSARDGNALITVLRVDPAAEYSKVVEILDILNIAETELVKEYKAQGKKRDRKFSIMPMEENIKTQLATL